MVYLSFCIYKFHVSPSTRSSSNWFDAGVYWSEYDENIRCNRDIILRCRISMLSLKLVSEKILNIFVLVFYSSCPLEF